MRTAFSLVELMVSMGLLAMVAALAVPAFQKLRSDALDTQCTSNLRQMGLGICQYVHDNAGTLPGPLNAGQLAYNSSYSQLSRFVADYLNLDRDSRKRRADVFVCPAFRALIGERVAVVPVYRVNAHVTMRGFQGPQPPFGYPNSQFPDVYNTRLDFMPMKAVKLADIVDEQGNPAQATTFAIKDMDAADAYYSQFLKSYGKTGLLPKKAHGDRRNALFFDFHVEAVDFSPTP